MTFEKKYPAISLECVNSGTQNFPVYGNGLNGVLIGIYKHMGLILPCSPWMKPTMVEVCGSIIRRHMMLYAKYFPS